MAKKQNHKIFNLIVMIFISIIGISVLSVSYASEMIFDEDSNGLLLASDTRIFPPEDVESGSNRDYMPKNFEDESHEESTDSSSMWSYINNNMLFQELRKNVALWYTILRYAAIAGMLVTLIILSIKLAIASLAEEKALYKRAIANWVACFILLYFIHYFMIFILYLNENLIGWFRDFSMRVSEGKEYGLYETARSRAYDIKFTVGFTGMIMYISLIYLTVKYIFMYAKRTIVIIILTLLSPIVVMIYSLQRILYGKDRTKILKKWMEEYATNVLLQSIHALVYAVFVGLALDLVHESVLGFVLSFVFLNFFTKADSTFRRIFKFSDGSKMTDEISKTTPSEFTDKVSSALATASIAKQTGIGKKVGSFYSSVGYLPKMGLVYAGSKLENSKLGVAIGDRLEQRREQKSQERNDLYKSQIEDYDKQIKDLSSQANNTKSNAQRAQLDNQIKQLKRQRQKIKNKQGKYNYRRGLFQRIRHTFDPDAYMEYVYDENGNRVHETDEDGNELSTYKRRVVRVQKVYNSETREYEKFGGLNNLFKQNKEEIFGFNSSDKELLKQIRTDIRDGVLGFGGLILGTGMIADRPSIGFALLAKSASNLRRLSKDPNDSLKISRKLKKRMAKQKYTFSDFSTGSWLSIDDEIARLTSTDPSVGKINDIIMKIQSGTLGYKIPTALFTLTGTKGMLVNALDMQRKMTVQHIKDIKKFEVGINAKVMKSLSREIIESYEHYLTTVTEHVIDESTIRLVYEQRIEDGSIYVDENGDFAFGFNTTQNQNVLTPESRFRQAVIDTAIQNHIFSLERFDLDNEFTKKALFENLKRQGYIDSERKNEDAVIASTISEFEKLKTEEPDLIKEKIFESVVVEYAKDMHVTTADELKTKAAYSAMATKYLDKISSKHQDMDMKKIIIDAVSQAIAQDASQTGTTGTSQTGTTGASQTGTAGASQAGTAGASQTGTAGATGTGSRNKISYDSYTAARIAEIIKNGDQETFERFNQAMVSSGITDSFEETVEKKKKQMDRSFDDMIMGALVSENITDVQSVDLRQDNDTKMVALKANLMAYFDFAGFDVANETLVDIVQSRIENLSDEDIQKSIIRTEISKFIESKCDGDSEKLKDPNMKAKLDEIIEKRLLEFYKAEDEAVNYPNSSNIADQINQRRNSSSSQNNNQQNGSNHQGNFASGNVSADEEENMFDINIPQPEVKVSISEKGKVRCFFSIPKKYKNQNYVIESCIMNLNGDADFSPNKDMVEIQNASEIACARLTKDGKYGPALPIKYPEDALSIVNKIKNGGEIDDAQKDELRERGRTKKSKLEQVASSVLGSIKPIDDEHTQEENVGKEVVEASRQDDVEELFKRMQIQKQKNRVVDLVSKIQDSKAKYIHTDEKAKQTVQSALDEADRIQGMKMFYDDSDDSETEYYEQYREDVNSLLDKLLQAKMLDEDSKQIKLNNYPKERKTYKEHQDKYKKRVKTLSVDDLISQINERRAN